MSRWLVQLQGEVFDTEEFSFWFPDGDIHAVSEGDNTYLVGSGLDALSDATEVNEVAVSHLEALYAAIHILDPGIRKPSIGVVWRESDDGQRHGYANMSATLGGRSKMRGTLSRVGDDSNCRRDTQAQVLLKAARSDRRLGVALFLLAIPNASWPHLYRSLEEIEFYLGKKVSAAGLCSDNERERFTRSANSGEIAGTDARHRLGKFIPPDNPMSLKEAHSFVRIALQSVLGSVENAA